MSPLLTNCIKNIDHLLVTTETFKAQLLKFASFFTVFLQVSCKKVFHFNTNIPHSFYCRNPKTVKYRTETISYLVPKIWSLVPEFIKSIKSLDVVRCLMSLDAYNTYLQHVGFIQFFHYSLFQKRYLIRFEPMIVSCLVFFRILIPYLDTNGIYITKNAIKWNKECYKTKMEKL